MSNYFVYILASQKNGTLYTGVTNDLTKRVYEHKQGLVPGFTKKYKVHNLVYFENTEDVMSAITREKHIKKWNRSWKVELIEKSKVFPDLKGKYISEAHSRNVNSFSPLIFTFIGTVVLRNI